MSLSRLWRLNPNHPPLAAPCAEDGSAVEMNWPSCQPASTAVLGPEAADRHTLLGFRKSAIEVDSEPRSSQTVSADDAVQPAPRQNAA